MTIFIDRHADVIALRLRLARAPRGQVYLNALHVDLAQAHHHEAGEQKEHDVDQRDDLDPRSFVRNWRAYVHWMPLDGRAFPRSWGLRREVHLARRGLCS